MGRIRNSSTTLTLDGVARELTVLVEEMNNVEERFRHQLSQLHENFKLSGTNLIHYLVLRSAEVRDLQTVLHQAGLSSLTNSESHTLSQLQHVLQWLKREIGLAQSRCDAMEAARLRAFHSEKLLGPFPLQDRPHIMVTFGAELIQNRKQIEEMLNEGMSVARINCAHDDATVWKEMIRLLQKAMAKTGKRCKIYMDLAGPKIRVKNIEAKKKKENDALPVWEGKELILRYAAEVSEKPLKPNKSRVDILFVEPKKLLTEVRIGEHIFFDDGKFEAKVIGIDTGQVEVEIVRISTKNPVLKPEKGINLPDSDLTIEALTEEDKRNIPFICRYADMIGFSFVNHPDDIEVLRSELNKYTRDKRPSIILKIERLSAIQNLPALLMNGMKDDSLGVMIARGDLAVEIGFERLSEIQEEILWICEAAHVPVIWATQVLETLNKTGYATRSEITDAAMSVRSECVMLNKGKYIVKTIKTLEDILNRQIGHVNKKQYIMRPLGIARAFIKASREEISVDRGL